MHRVAQSESELCGQWVTAQCLNWSKSWKNAAHRGKQKRRAKVVRSEFVGWISAVEPNSSNGMKH